MSPEQCRAARALLGWNQIELMRRSGVSKRTIQAFESGGAKSYALTLMEVRRAFEQAGVEFIRGAGGREGLTFGGGGNSETADHEADSERRQPQ